MTLDLVLLRTQKWAIRQLRAAARRLESLDLRCLADGKRVRLGMRVVLDRAALERHRLAHAYDDKVHEITSLLGGDCQLVGLGPRQMSVSELRRAPRGSTVSCGQCARWPETVARWKSASAGAVGESKEIAP